ncbi:MAG: hypothetical protein ABIZ52_01240 [Candidatus Limnocylindrales bacterium]
MPRPERAAPRRLASVVLATALALALGLSPEASRPALAASDPLRTQADATYTLDPGAGRVHVAIAIKETDLKPNSSTSIYYYTAFRFVLQEEATSVRVSGGSAYRITTKKRDGYIEATVQIGKALFYKQTTSFTIRYELPGGKPRSASPTRVGAAFSTFGVWAFGDKGYSTVEVRTPAGFDTRVSGDSMQATTSATTGVILRAKPADPSTFFAIVTAENSDAYAETRLSLEGDVEIVVQSWPEDGKWKDAVTGALRDTMPALRDLIGLDWPVEHDLDVRERYTPDLEGYAGFFLTKEQRIEVSEDLDPVVIVHEASHAWFNDSLFLERWIYEGLAEEYAWRALSAVGGEDGDAAELPKLDDPGFADLATWTHPGVIRDQETDDSERYGYQAAFWVIHQVTESAGVDVMRDAFSNAEANLTAYPGAGDPETVLAGDGWRRLLDLTEPLDKPDPAAVDEAFRDFVLGFGDEATLDARDVARDAYRVLLQSASGWLPPWYVRKPMGDWSFKDATKAMTEATAVLDLRDRVATEAKALGLEPTNALQEAYEGAKDGLADAATLAQAQLDALAAIRDAKGKVEATPDFVAQVGLLGELPLVPYNAARDAFQMGSMDESIRQASTASSIITGAPAAGQQRLIIAAVSAGSVVLLLLLLVVLLRRRSRRGRAVALTTASAAGLATAPATLAADPPTDQDEGGHARGDTPADP